MLALLLTLLPSLACHAIHSDWIHGRDLAAALPGWAAAIPSDVPIGLAPAPGQQRMFRAPELRRLAIRYSLANELPEAVCFAWPLTVPARPAMQAEMEKTLAGHHPQIELLEASQLPAPEGELMFPLSGLSTTIDGLSVWRGYVRYAENRKFPVWARVRISVHEPRLLAAVDLHAGDILDSTQLRVETYHGPLPRGRFLSDPTQAAGRLLRCPITAGAPVIDNMLDAPREISRGDTVNAIVSNGGARLEVQAIAEADGHKGQIITVRNPRSGRLFRGRVEDKGTVTVVPGGEYGLATESRKS